MELYRDKTLAPAVRAADLLSKMTLEEKIAQINIIRGVEFSVKGLKNGTCTVEAEN